MPLFLDTRGNTTLGIGICARCSEKFPLGELLEDPNYPGLRVCRDDLDVLDPYRLPARTADSLVLPFCRPDVALSASAPVPLYTNPLFGFVTQFGIAQAWQPNTVYSVGDSTLPLPEAYPTPLPQVWMVCIVAGTSGETPPVWPTEAGVIVGNIDPVLLSSDLSGMPAVILTLLADDGVTILTADGGGDGGVSWVCIGVYPY